MFTRFFIENKWFITRKSPRLTSLEFTSFVGTSKGLFLFQKKEKPIGAN